MKNIILAFLIVISNAVVAQKAIKKIKLVTITQKVIKKKGIQLVLKNVFDDSRCPEGTQCIWAGEVSIVILVYKNNTLIEEKAMTLSMKNDTDNFEWFAKQLCINKSRIKLIQVVPYPKNGVALNPNEYVVKIEYSQI
jgi:hypothetical protein